MNIHRKAIYKGGAFMKRKYETPRVIEEIFAAENYCVSACYELACDYGIEGGNYGLHIDADRDYSGQPGDSSWKENHTKRSDKTGCGWAKNQVIRKSSDGSSHVYEINAQGINQDLLCTILKEDGNTVYWTTTNNGRTWSHKGTYGSVKNPSHPNMS